MKHVMITGCTRGLGLAMARSFAKRGWRVSGCGTKRDAVERLATELEQADSNQPGTHLIRACDVTSAVDVAKLAEEILATAGGPDLLLNNAAVINPNAPLWEVSPEAFSRVIDVNLKGIHLVLRAFLPAMIARGHGVVVNFSSGWGRSTSPEVAPYCCTKWGVEGLTQALSQELPPGLAAIALNPGIIDTEMLQLTFGPLRRISPTPPPGRKKRCRSLKPSAPATTVRR